VIVRHTNGNSARISELHARTSAKTVDSALRILDLFNHTAPEWTVREIAQRLDLPYSTAHRYVSTLEASGYLIRYRPTGTYRIGLKLIELAGVALNQIDVRVHGLRDLDHLADVTGLNANIAVLDEGDAFHIAYSVRSAVPRMYTALGRRAVAHCTALGKVLLADLPLEQVRRLIDVYGWRPYTDKSIQNFPELERTLAEVRANGYAIDRDERAIGISCVAAPIRNKLGQVVAAICVTGPSDQIPSERIPELVKIVRKHASSISYQLGYDDADPGFVLGSRGRGVRLESVEG
jgi:IclR family KDG regulon transcriptional repressor